MPELPDLEVMREGLDRRLVGREILAANAYSPSILKTASIPLEELVGERFAAVSRRGKHLILTCRDDLHVVVHLMLAGRLVIGSPPSGSSRYRRCSLSRISRSG